MPFSFVCAMSSNLLNLDLHDATGTLPTSSLDWLNTHVIAAAKLMGVSGELCVRVVNDAEMAAAHERYTGVSGTTDVLTFDLRDTSSATSPIPPLSPALEISCEQCSVLVRHKSVVYTDIMTCRDVAYRESLVLGTSIERELLLYIIHGILHCIGFNDHEEADAALMHRVEDAVLTGIGVGSIYKP